MATNHHLKESFMKLINDVDNWKLNYYDDDICVATKSTKKSTLLKVIIVVNEISLKDSYDFIKNVNESGGKNWKATRIQTRLIMKNDDDSDLIHVEFDLGNSVKNRDALVTRYTELNDGEYFIYGASSYGKKLSKRNGVKRSEIFMVGCHCKQYPENVTFKFVLDIDPKLRFSLILFSSIISSISRELINDFLNAMKLPIIRKKVLSYSKFHPNSIFYQSSVGILRADKKNKFPKDQNERFSLVNDISLDKLTILNASVSNEAVANSSFTTMEI